MGLLSGCPFYVTASEGLYSIEDLSSKVSRIAEEYGFLRVSLFGSRTRGDSRRSSDYDFCVMPSPENSLLDLSGFRLDMEVTLDAEADVVSECGLSERFR